MSYPGDDNPEYQYYASPVPLLLNRQPSSSDEVLANVTSLPQVYSNNRHYEREHTILEIPDTTELQGASSVSRIATQPETNEHLIEQMRRDLNISSPSGRCIKRPSCWTPEVYRKQSSQMVMTRNPEMYRTDGDTENNFSGNHEMSGVQSLYSEELKKDPTASTETIDSHPIQQTVTAESAPHIPPEIPQKIINPVEYEGLPLPRRLRKKKDTDFQERKVYIECTPYYCSDLYVDQSNIYASGYYYDQYINVHAESYTEKLYVQEQGAAVCNPQVPVHHGHIAGGEPQPFPEKHHPIREKSHPYFKNSYKGLTPFQPSELERSSFYKFSSVEVYTEELKNPWIPKSFKKPCLYLTKREKAAVAVIDSERSPTAIEPSIKTDTKKTSVKINRLNKNERKNSCNQYKIYFWKLYQSAIRTFFLLNKDTMFTLSNQIWGYFLNNQLNEKKFMDNILVCNEVESIINQSFPDNKFILVGSLMSGLGHMDSDINITIVSPKIIQCDTTAARTTHANKIQKVLYKHDIINNRKITGDINPKICFTCRKYNHVYVGVTVNDYNSIRNTRLNYLYTQCDWRFQPIYCFIKKWAENHDLCEQTDLLLSSYSISVMVIYFLQHGVSPEVLPVIQEHDEVVFHLDFTEPIDLTENWHFKWVSCNEMALSELIRQFFFFYKSFDFSHKVISIKSSSIVTRTAPVGDGADNFVYIQDPFTSENVVTGFTYDHQLRRLVKLMASTCQLMDKETSISVIIRHY